MRPKLSIITVTRNLIDGGRQESFLSAMDCVQMQTTREIEHVVLDGASDDGTQGLIESVISALGDPASGVPVTYRSEQDSGLYDAMNKAVGLAQGDFVLFLNSDDGLASNHVAAQLVDAMGRGRPDFIYGATMQLLPDGSTKTHARTNLRAFLQRMPFSHNSVALRRDMFLALGGHDLKYRVASDYDLMVRMLMAGHVGSKLNEPISLYASRGVSGDSMAVAQDYARIWCDHYAKVLGRPISEDEALDWYRRGQLPARLCLTLMQSREQFALVRSAARHSLGITLRRRLQPWRSWDNIGQ